jgi:uncharacterized damage-inducible protein DinB
MVEQLIETWNIHQRINLYLLDAIPDAALASVPTGMKGRSVGEMFAHMHNIRLSWLEVTVPAAVANVPKIPLKSKADKQQITKSLLIQTLDQSSQATVTMFKESAERGKIKNIKLTPTAFLGYLIAHESYHRGEICMTLTEAGHKLPDEVLYGMWE